MAKGSSPSQDQLLELLKRAADELKHAKEEARTAITALQKEQAAHQQTEAELEGIKNQTKAGKAQASTDEQLLEDRIEAERENAKALEGRVKELEQGLESAIAEREALRQRVTDGDTAISVTQQQEESKRAALMQEHANALDALKAELASALESQKSELEKALEAAGAEQAEAEAHNKGMLDDAAGKLVTMESQLTQERDKHQATAQKLLETRSKVRELESAVAAEQDKVKTLEATIKQMSEAHERELRDKTHTLTQNLDRAQAELARVTDSWQQVERQYEALHREMLMTLEQRDDARRLLDNERAERERLSRALQGHRQ